MRLKIDHKQDDTGSIIVRGLSIEVKILEVRTMRGKTRYLVEPVAGSGQLWTDSVYPLTKVNIPLTQVNGA